MKKISLTFLMIAAIMLTFAGCGSEEFESSEHFEKEGVYLTVVAFNNGITHVTPLRYVDKTSAPIIKRRIGNLEMGDGTALYYAMDSAMDILKCEYLPKNLFNISMISFTDGIDQASTEWKKDKDGRCKYTSRQEYQDAIKNRILTEYYEGGLQLDAYGIGVNGGDVGDENLFNKIIEDISSKPENKHVLKKFSEVEETFKDIAKDISTVTTKSDLAVSIMSGDNGDICFTFDGKEPEISGLWIQAHLNSFAKSLTIKECEGIKFANKDSEIRGEQVKGAQYKYTFKEIEKSNGEPLSKKEKTRKLALYRAMGGKWQKDSEFSPSETVQSTETRKTIAIALVLDMSNSLEASGCRKIKNAAKDFIDILVETDE